MWFSFCLVAIRKRKLALFQDPECERCTADKTFLDLIQMTYMPAMIEMTAIFFTTSWSLKTIILSWLFFSLVQKKD